jgi:DNA-binding MarR family transcriptional regulator
MPPSRKYPTADSVILLMRLSLLGLLRNTVNKINQKHGISANAWYFLRILWEKDGLSQKELALRAGVMQPNAVATIRSMEKMDLVRVEREEHDRRGIYVWLTPKAKELEAEFVPRFIQHANQILSACLDDEEIQSLTHLLKKLGTHVNNLR